MSLALEWKDAVPAGSGESRGPDAEAWRRRARASEGRRLRLVFACFIAVAAFVCALFILNICLHVLVVQNEIRTRELERQIELERRGQEAMRVEIASLESPARIEKMAVEQLMMVQVSGAEYLETPAYQAAKARGKEGAKQGEGAISDAAGGEQR